MALIKSGKELNKNTANKRLQELAESKASVCYLLRLPAPLYKKLKLLGIEKNKTVKDIILQRLKDI